MTVLTWVYRGRWPETERLVMLDEEQAHELVRKGRAQFAEGKSAIELSPVDPTEPDDDDDVPGDDEGEGDEGEANDEKPKAPPSKKDQRYKTRVMVPDAARTKIRRSN